SRSQAEWVAFVDAGATWNPDLLVAVERHFADPEIAAIAPSYQALGAGSLEGGSWKLERVIKRIESAGAGPVRLHGARVFYRRCVLLAALGELQAGSRAWLNDDVVIPLLIRIRSPRSRIVYTERADGQGWVRDRGVRADGAMEARRRKRI